MSTRINNKFSGLPSGSGSQFPPSPTLLTSYDIITLGAHLPGWTLGLPAVCCPAQAPPGSVSTSTADSN